MEHFQNYQVGTWLSNGLIVRAQEIAEAAFSIVKDKVPSVLRTTAATCAATVVWALPALGFAMGGERSDSHPIPSVQEHSFVESASHAAVSEQIASMQGRMNAFRERLASRQFGLSVDALHNAKKARESSMARNDEDATVWATELVKSQLT